MNLGGAGERGEMLIFFYDRIKIHIHITWSTTVGTRYSTEYGLLRLGLERWRVQINPTLCELQLSQ
jgi:hypothetical protein